MSVENTPRLINSGKPFRNMAIKYHEAGWYPLPLPPRQKEMPPTGYTGHNKNKYMSVDKAEQITTWLENHPKDANIGMWLHDGVVGLDVDAYFKGEKQYEGQLTFAEMEKKLGALPPTWTSTARSDKVSGIRFFQVPKGLVFPGKAGPGIDIIFSGYRYTVVYPSSHPEGGQYQWYRPGMDLDGAPARWTREAVEHPDSEWKHTFARIEAFGEYPHPDDLTYLPEAWVEALTLGKKTDRPMDVASTIPDLDKWVVDNFQNTTLARGEWCSMLKKTVKKHVDAVKENADSHQYLTNAHWSLVNLGLEGHEGWGTAMKLFDKFFTKEMMRRGKRLPNELRGEIFRSKYNAIRLIKGKVDMAAEESGISLFTPRCACFKEAEGTAEGSKPAPKPTGKASDPTEYRMNDDGNGEHLNDLYGENLVWIPGYGKWMFWNGERWEQDEDGIARRCYWKVRDRQEAAVDQLWEFAKNQGDTPEGDQARAKAKKFAELARSSGSNRGASGALDAAKSIEGVSINAELLDRNERLLGVENGVLELHSDKAATFRKAKHDDYVTVNTGIPYMEPLDLAKAGGDIAKGRVLWKNYLDRFLPDPTLRKFIQKALGYCLLGTNEQRLAIFLYGGTSTGKSTMLNAVMAAMGGYAETVDLAIFKEKASGLNPALAQAMPRRIITSSEAGMQNHMHADLFKRMTGNDRISAELKGVNVIVTRIPAFTPLIATNSPPTIKGADAALQKRLLILPFNEQVTESDDEKSASLDLAKYAAPIILNWLVQGWTMYAKEGLDRRQWPTVVGESTKEFGSQLNDIGEFLAEQTEPAEGSPAKKQSEYSTPMRDMYDAYQRWCMENKISERDVYNVTMFGRMIRGAGVEVKNVKVNGVPVKSAMFIKVIEPKMKIKHLVEGKN